MKKITRKLAYLLFTVIYLVTVSSLSTAFAADKTMSVTLRIEGTEKNLFYATKEIPYTGTLTLAQALTYIDTQEDSIQITGLDKSYITDINGEAAAAFGGWDGWLFKVNGQDSAVGIDSLELADGDSVLLYYGDPFGVGMQFPVADTSDIADGVITFTSSDTTYDADGNPAVTVNPVKAATVTWSNGDTSTEYVTDENGSVTIDADQLTPGAHALQITKTAESGLPLVLRYAPDYSVNVETTAAAASDLDTTKDNTAATQDTVKEAPKTGEQNAAPILVVLAIAAFGGIILIRRKENYEK